MHTHHQQLNAYENTTPLQLLFVCVITPQIIFIRLLGLRKRKEQIYKNSHA